jgi:muconolactone D-isomerase
MLFYVSMRVRIPHDVDREIVKQLTEKEGARHKELEAQGKWPHVWRVVGKWANVSIFDVDSPLELHQILGSLPLFPYMEIEVTALCEMHPALK